MKWLIACPSLSLVTGGEQDVRGVIERNPRERRGVPTTTLFVHGPAGM